MPRSLRGDEPPGGGRVGATGQRQARYYTPQDVALHNCAEDCWVSLFGQVRLTWKVCGFCAGFVMFAFNVTCSQMAHA